MKIEEIFEELSNPCFNSVEGLKKSFKEIEKKVRMLNLEELIEIISHKYDTTIAFSVFSEVSVFFNSAANETIRNIICDIAVNELIRRVCFIQTKRKQHEPITRYNLLHEICKTNGWHYEYLNNPKCISDSNNLFEFLLRYINCFLISKEGGTTYYLHNAAHKYIDCLPEYQKEIMFISGKNKYIPYKPEYAELHLEKRCYQDILKAAIAVSEAGEFARNDNFLAKYTIPVSEKVISLPYSEEEIETFNMVQLKEMAQHILNIYCEDAVSEQFYQKFRNFYFYDSFYRKEKYRFNDIFHDRYIHAICPICGNLMHPVFYRQQWIWWHDKREDFFNGSHNTFTSYPLTDDELRKYHLNFLYPADENYDENNCHLDVKDKSEINQKESDADKNQDFLVEILNDFFEENESS